MSVAVSLDILIVVLTAVLLVVVFWQQRRYLHLKRRQQLSQVPTDTTSALFHDEITGFPNKRLLQHCVYGLLQQHPQQRYSLLLLKIKDFSEVNQLLGYELANVLLTQIATRIDQQLADYAEVLQLEGRIRVCHAGGVDFAIWLNSEQRHHLAEQIAQRIELQTPEPLVIQGCAVNYRIASAVVHYPEHGVTLAELMQHAYLALEQHRFVASHTQVFDPGMRQLPQQRLVLMQQLQAAISAHQLQLDVLPQIDLTTRHVLAAEVLVRWPHPDKGVLQPAAFIPLAEQMGMVFPLTLWVIEQALQELMRLSEQQSTVAIAVNVASSDLLQPELIDAIADLLTRYPVNPAALILEFKEQCLQHPPAHLRSMLQQLKALGLRLALDDFGTGFFSVAQLQELPIDSVKVDCRFINDLHRSESQVAITSTMVELALRLQLHVVAEGVEDASAEEKLLSMGCHSAQGFYYSRPFALHGLHAWLGQWQHHQQLAAQPQTEAPTRQ